jgi:hypothetical protein
MSNDGLSVDGRLVLTVLLILSVASEHNVAVAIQTSQHKLGAYE